jgi:hypothetical protein
MAVNAWLAAIGYSDDYLKALCISSLSEINLPL